MKWQYTYKRCVRRFALFPTKEWHEADGRLYVYWLEYYYVIQRRNSLNEWITQYAVDRETWLKWKQSKKGAPE